MYNKEHFEVICFVSCREDITLLEFEMEGPIIVSFIENLSLLVRFLLEVLYHLITDLFVRVHVGCESLQKLDLTVNFVGDLLSIESLKVNEHLREMYKVILICFKYIYM